MQQTQRSSGNTTVTNPYERTGVDSLPKAWPSQMDKDMKSLSDTKETREISSVVVEKTTLEQQREFEKSLRWKCDFHVLPPLCMLFCFIFLDRANIGNAVIEGLPRDLKMTGTDFNVALMVFFVLYLPLEIPANLLMRKVNPSIWLSSMTFACGVFTICEGITQSYAGLVVCRILLGAAEAGFVPGSLFLINSYYQKYELNWRINLFLASAIISVAFSGLLAYAISHLDGVCGYAGWRWIFIIEGLITSVVSIPAFWLIPAWPETAKWLSEPERNFLTQRLLVHQETEVSTKQQRSIITECFTDPKIWFGSMLYFCMLVSSYSGAYFVPTILRDLGWVSSKAQVMSIPIWVCAFVASLCASRLSDRTQKRLLIILLGCLLCGSGFVVMLSTTNRSPGVRYFALYLINVGIVCTQPTILTWQADIIDDKRKRGLAVAIQVTIGNSSGLLASNIWLQSEAPTFALGYGMCLGFVVVLAFTAVGLETYLQRSRRSVEQKKEMA